jgi:hypothetical protein
VKKADKIHGLCMSAKAEAAEQLDEDEIAALACEPPDFGGNQDDAIRFGEDRGKILGAAALAEEILKNL